MWERFFEAFFGSWNILHHEWMSFKVKWNSIEVHFPLPAHWFPLNRDRRERKSIDISRRSQSFPYDIAQDGCGDGAPKRIPLLSESPQSRKCQTEWIASVWIWFEIQLEDSCISCSMLQSFRLSSIIAQSPPYHPSHTHLIAESFLREIPEHVVSSIIFYHRCHHHHDYYYHHSSQRHLCTGSCTSHLPNNKLKWRL